MPKKYSYLTPKGEFVSLAQAAAAMACNRSTIVNRCVTDPENYSRHEFQPPPPRPKIKTWTMTAKTTWPLTWTQYKGLAFEAKEEIWLAWCGRYDLDPEQESTVDRFFEEMDLAQQQQNEQHVV